MNRQIIITATLSICILLSTGTQANSDDNPKVPTISVTKLDINDEALNLVYEIRNESKDDVWILAGWDRYRNKFGMSMSAGESISEDGRTLTINPRFNVPQTALTSVLGNEPMHARFVRLYPGERQTESYIARIPAYLSPYTEHAKRREQIEQGLEYATSLAIQLSYFYGNLPERILKTLKPPENILPKVSQPYPVSPDIFCSWNERLTSRDEELSIPKRFNGIKGESEHILRTVVENLNIPYMEKIYHPSRLDPPDLTTCVKVELRYKPSMLEYFFPYASQQDLLSTNEMEYLRSDKTIVLKDKQKINAFANDILRTKTSTISIGGIGVRYRSYVDVVCHYTDASLLSFPIYNYKTILIEGEEFWSSEGFPSLKILTPQIQSIDFRTMCATNLKNLWYRLRFYNQGEAIRQNDSSIRSQTLYPIPNQWCDNILNPYPAWGGITIVRRNAKLLICPSAGKGKNHYAMNPNCKPDSPADMVLLFETKGGWNQHGGPELFTFDNHDPKGGCVLLNDGTVKFIRTPEELRQLRWK
jgi:hypothetical protein